MSKPRGTIELDFEFFKLSYVKGQEEEVAKVLKLISHPYTLSVLDFLFEGNPVAQIDMAKSLYQNDKGTPKERPIYSYRSFVSQAIDRIREAGLELDAQEDSRRYPHGGGARIKMVRLKQRQTNST